MASRIAYSKFANQIARLSGRPKTFALASAARAELERGRQDTDSPEA